MRTFLFGALSVLLVAHAYADDTTKHKPYAGQEQREIKALSPDFVEGLKAGQGLGFAKSAELNGYPGPAHLLELASELPLNAEQVQAITDIRGEMLGAAVPLGLQLVEAEKELERAFRSRAIDQAALGRLTEAAAVITGQLRGAHLGAHIKATALLTPRQIHRYQALRGYAAGHADHAGGHKH